MDVKHCKNCEDRLGKDEEKTENKEHEITCSICLEEIQEKDAAESVPCAHIFHEICLRTSLSYNIRCPMCRSEILVFRRVLSDTLMDVPQNGIGDSNNNNRNIGMRLEATPGEIHQLRELVEGLEMEQDIISRHFFGDLETEQDILSRQLVADLETEQNILSRQLFGDLETEQDILSMQFVEDLETEQNIFSRQLVEDLETEQNILSRQLVEDLETEQDILSRQSVEDLETEQNL